MNITKLIACIIEQSMVTAVVTAFKVTIARTGPVFIFLFTLITHSFFTFDFLKRFIDIYRIAFWFLMPVLLCSPAFAQHEAPLPNNILKVKNTIDFTVTGDGNSENWRNTEWNILPQHNSQALVKAGWNISPKHRDDPDVQYGTCFKVLYSTNGIYCLFKCEDSVITATLKGDFLNLFDEDVVEVFLRPDTSMPVYFEYELSPLNFELPILILNNKGKTMGWKPWQYEGRKKVSHAVKISDKNPGNTRFSWTAELFIPFSLLTAMDNVPPKKGTRWRGNFYRIDYDRNPVYFGWQLTRGSFHDPEKFGILEFE